MATTEVHTLRRDRSLLQMENGKLREQRDALLEAARFAKKFIGPLNISTMGVEAVSVLASAIAKAGGQAMSAHPWPCFLTSHGYLLRGHWTDDVDEICQQIYFDVRRNGINKTALRKK